VGFGVTNLVARATPGIDTLRTEEYAAGVRVLRRKVRRFRPELVAFVGVSLYRAVFAKKGSIALGLQDETFEGARVFVLPNPSGRNANVSYAEMLGAFKALAACVRAGVPRSGGTELPRLRSGRHQSKTTGPALE
jgi:double-stranded uracil-DNA glycosylase